jgi:hypothetical protein
VAGSHPTATCESTRRRALVDGRRSDSTKPVALTCGWWKRLWLVIITLSRERRRAVAGDKGVRGTLVDPASGRTSRLRVVNDTNNVDHPRTWIPIFDGGTHPETTRSSVTEARLRAVKRVRAGAGLPQGGLASRGRSRLTPTKHPRDLRWRKPWCPEIERTVGCTCRWLVAEIGEKHLSTTSEGSREANRGRRWVARSGSALVTEGSRPDRAKRVRGRSRERNRDRNLLHSIARSRIELVEGALGSRATQS